MKWFLISNCQNPSCYHQSPLIEGTQYNSELDLITDLLGVYKKDSKISCWVEVNRFLKTVLELIITVHNLPLDTFIITDYYRTMSCCRLALFKSETVINVSDIQIEPALIEEWFMN